MKRASSGKLKRRFEDTVQKPIEDIAQTFLLYKLLTELVSYMYPTYVHNMHIFDVLSFLFGSRHRPY